MEISPEYSFEELMLKLKLQYFSQLLQRADSLEKTLMLGKTEGGRRRGWQRMRWLDGITELGCMWVWADCGSWWSEAAQKYPTLCDPTDCSLPGFSIHGIFQARVLEWVAISFSRGSSWPRNWTPGLLHCRQGIYPLSHQRSPGSWWTGKPGMLQSMGSQRVRHDLMTVQQQLEKLTFRNKKIR